MTRTEIEVKVDKAITPLDAAARDLGHDPHPWNHNVDGNPGHSFTVCRLCGGSAFVRVRPDGDVNKGGLSKPCPQRRRT